MILGANGFGDAKEIRDTGSKFIGVIIRLADGPLSAKIEFTQFVGLAIARLS